MRNRDMSRHLLTPEWIQRIAERVRTQLSRDDLNVRRLRGRGFEVAALDAHVLAQHNRRYSLELPTGAIRNQEQSGRCWLFAPVVLARTAALRDGRIGANESFSENYLYFFNLLEQASAARGLAPHCRQQAKVGRIYDSATGARRSDGLGRWRRMGVSTCAYRKVWIGAGSLHAGDGEFEKD